MQALSTSTAIFTETLSGPSVQLVDRVRNWTLPSFIGFREKTFPEVPDAYLHNSDQMFLDNSFQWVALLHVCE